MAIICKACIEIPTLLIFFCFLLTDFVTINFVIYRTCYVTLGYNETDCALLGTNSDREYIQELETIVQPKTTLIMMSKTIIEVIISVFGSLIVGPWSNKHGRKPILISAFTGYFLCYISLIILCLLPWVSPWYYLISCLASVIGGGVCSMLTVSYCYVADSSTENNRGIRMGILQACSSLGSLLGTISSSYIFNYVGYLGIYCISSGLLFFAILYTYFLLPESLPVVDNENMLKDLLDKSVIIKTVKTCFKRRPNKNRILLFLLMSLIIILAFASSSDFQIFFLFVRKKFNWSLQHFTLFTTVTNLIDILGTIFILIVLHKYFKISDMVLILFGLVALCVSSVIFGLAQTNSIVYLGASIKRFSCTIGPLGRSAISKIIPSDDLGHIFAFTTSLETVVQLISSPLYTLLYNHTIQILPGAFNYLSAAIFSVNIFVISAVIIIKKKVSTDYLNVEQKAT